MGIYLNLRCNSVDESVLENMAEDGSREVELSAPAGSGLQVTAAALAQNVHIL